MAQDAQTDGTIGKALDVLDRVAAFGRPVRFSEVLAASPYPKATLFRVLRSLARQGMLGFDAGNGTYVPGVRLLRLAHLAWRQASLAPLARPHLDALSRRLGETIHLAQLDGAHVLYVDKRNAATPVEMFSEAGKVGPAWCTGVGKAMLAFLPEATLAALLPQMSFHAFTAATLTDPAALSADLALTRARGYALDAEEHEPGILCLAVPVLSASGRMLGAISVTSTSARTTLAGLVPHAATLAEAAARIAAEAEDRQFPQASRSD